jgi:hypothetical protein
MEPYDEGYDARLKGYASWDNPFVDQDQFEEEAMEWSHGWDAANETIGEVE